MLETEVYTKTDAGREEIRSRALGLPMSVRAILLMVDGQRTVAAMRTLIAGSKAPADVLDVLVAEGLIAPRALPAAAVPAPPVPSPVERRPASVEPAPAPPPTIAYDGAIDLILPTIHGPEVDPVPASPVAESPVVAPPAVVPQNRYEHLYTMMNEIVRDFLAPHRRYFLQLKIERCATPEELLELLYDLQVALSKARGEAFASEVIARLRNAAA